MGVGEIYDVVSIRQVCMESMGVTSGCGFNEVYRLIITYLYS